jgi:hypothetical protein
MSSFVCDDQDLTQLAANGYFSTGAAQRRAQGGEDRAQANTPEKTMATTDLVRDSPASIIHFVFGASRICQHSVCLVRNVATEVIK